MFVQPPGGSVIPIVAAAGYEPFGPLKALMMGNWIEEWRAFDRRYSPTAITATDGKSLPPVLDWAYTVDPAGNVTAIEDLLKAENNRSFGYEDFNYFLTTGNGPWGTRSWTYDAIGNRLSETRDGAGSTYSYVLNPAAQNTPRLQTISGAETATYLYDAVGNVDVESVPDPVDFTWNRASNLVGISDSSQLVYDGRGYLRSAARPGFAKASFETDLTYSTAGRLLAYESTEEEIQRKYKVVYLAGRPVAVVRFDVASQDVITHYYTTDHLGTPILVTDSAASVHWQVGLEPFGENDTNVLKFDVRLGFPGQYADLAWERDRPVLRYNVHRWYEPGTGRYTKPDPLGLETFLNLYTYVDSRPTFLVDWDGRQAFPGGSLPWVIPCVLAVRDAVRAEAPGRTRYQHCMGNCLISQNCPGGRLTAAASSLAKEISDLVKCATEGKQGACDSAFQRSDFQDNRRGRDCRPPETCSEQCGPLLQSPEPAPGPFGSGSGGGKGGGF